MTLSCNIRLLLAVFILFSWSLVHAETKPIILSESFPIQAPFQYIEDTSGQSNIEDIVKLPEDKWQLMPTGSANFGMTNTPYWLRFSVNNATQKNAHLIAGLDYSQLDDVVFYVFSGGNKLRELAIGDTRPFYPRDVDHPNMLLRFELSPEQMKTIYIRIQTNGSMILPFEIRHENQFFELASKEQKFHFFFYGCLTVIILINLAVFFRLREKLYLYYAFAIAGYLLFFASIFGYSFQHLYPQHPSLHGRGLLVSMPILAFFSVLFCREFLKTQFHSPKLDMALRAMMYFEVINFISALTFGYNIAIMFSAISAFFFFSILFVAGPISWAAGMRSGIFFTVAWIPFTIGMLATAGRSLGFFPENFMTLYAMQIGSGLEAFILTLALADRLYLEREEKIGAQADSLRKEKARHEVQTKLTQAMIYDSVTHLPNRNRFEWMVNQQLNKDPEGRYMVCVARVTSLNDINRTLGLTRSEQLLKRTAEEMTKSANQLQGVCCVLNDDGIEECVYQISGDSFGILVDPRKVNDNVKVLNKILKLFSGIILEDNLSIDLHPKYGASSYPEHGGNAALLIRNAHVGMEITPHGKQELGLYSPDYDIYSESRLTLMSDLREALQENKTELHYQPKISLKSGEVLGLEALIRWHHPERGWVYPNDFIPLAEETGVITKLTEWAIEQGIKDLVMLLPDNPKMGVSVNISARDLVSGDLIKLIESVLKQYGVSPEKLTVELTETAAMQDPEKGLVILKQLAEMGLQVSIDDFGSGYSSLSYLKQLPATEIKLDRSLIMDVCTSDSSKVIVETSINMAHGLGCKLVAEGIEDEETARLLKEMGCDMLQGYWLCRPQPVEKVKQWLAESRVTF